MPWLMPLHLAAALTATPWLSGGDVSMLAALEQSGAIFRDAAGPADALTLWRGAGWTCLRLRLFVRPDGQGGVVNDLPYTLALAKRIKAAGFTFSLDFHYSDTWADPQHQHKPQAWQALGFDALVAEAERYTADCLTQLRAAGALPEYVQLGNEITPGLLWPDGQLGGDQPQAAWDRLARLLRAGAAGVGHLPAEQRPQLVIHLDRGGDAAAVRWFCDQLVAHAVQFDVIGLSYYPWWHGDLDALRKTLDVTARRYHKPVWVVETAYPFEDNDHWRAQPHMAWPRTPAGQRQFAADLASAVRATPDGLGLGVLWWFPESVALPGGYTWNGGSTALFDRAGQLLPAASQLAPPAG